MQVQINTDHNINSGEALSDWIVGVVEVTLARASDHITRVEVHLSDENGRKSGQTDKRCMMEARIEGRSPVAVTEYAASIDRAVNGAAGKLARMIKSDTGRVEAS